MDRKLLIDADVNVATAAERAHLLVDELGNDLAVSAHDETIGFFFAAGATSTKFRVQ